jgi:hypothetical protein
MRTFWSCGVLLGAAVLAQAQSFQSQQQTTGVVGITVGQTARLNALYPTVPAPVLLRLCSVTLVIKDDQGGLVGTSKDFSQLAAGKSVSIDVSGDTDLSGAPRKQIYGAAIAPNGCHLVTTLEIIDNASQKTVLVVGGEPTFPFPQPAPAAPAIAWLP